MDFLAHHKDSITKLCAAYRVKRLYIFGSALGENMNEQSDVDLLVNFEPMDTASYTENYFGLKFSLEELFKKPVDLVEENYLTNPYFKESVLKSRQLVYGN